MAASNIIRRLANTFCFGVMFAACPIGAVVSFDQGVTFGFSLAHAKDGGRDSSGGSDDNSGSGRDSNRDDNSGSGRADDRESRSGDSDRDRSETVSDDSFDQSSGGARRISTRYNIRLTYTNGWKESIQNGRYALVDPNGRTVADRWAKPEDLRRLRTALVK